MKFNVDIVLKNLQGETLKDTDSKGEIIEATAKLAIVNAVLAPSQKQDSGVDKIKKYELAKKVFNGGNVDLNEDEIKMIKDCVNTIYPPLICGQLNEMLKV